MWIRSRPISWCWIRRCRVLTALRSSDVPGKQHPLQVIMLTEHGSEKYREMALRLGVFDYLQKWVGHRRVAFCFESGGRSGALRGRVAERT
jgi:hypothetical protein